MNTNQMLKFINVLANVSESRSSRLRPRVRSWQFAGCAGVKKKNTSRGFLLTLADVTGVVF